MGSCSLPPFSSFHGSHFPLSTFQHQMESQTPDFMVTFVISSLGPQSAIFKTWLLSISIVAIIVPGTGYIGPSMNPANASVSLNVWQPEESCTVWCSRGAAGADEDANGTEDFLRAPGVQTPVI
ncbi:hypothetical protein F3Y22_tig00110937pilonHSYRG00018 [Hibiscus syriacus]|uniref:Uncharacterized protein n=1 Tax=Hibiscus syriacus TaxID=106335 RepID=A0A6A2ZCX8_HIBSY|nr:hypothetical protein F3Y22_tig00110937pilonHSYRG00018 [Hibiscus syriacus]